jgi:transposase InsO family protein
MSLISLQKSLRNGIKHVKSASYDPASNGLAERFIQSLKQSFKASQQLESDGRPGADWVPGTIVACGRDWGRSTLEETCGPDRRLDCTSSEGFHTSICGDGDTLPFSEIPVSNSYSRSCEHPTRTRQCGHWWRGYFFCGCSCYTYCVNWDRSLHGACNPHPRYK